MESSITSFTLEKLYGNISRRMEQTSNLEDLNVSVGAVPLLAKRLYSDLNPYDQININDRLSGTYTISPKLKIHVQLAKIKIGNETRGIEVIRQFKDCKECIKISGCDKFETGSILFTRRMCTGYATQDVVVKKSIDLPYGNCEFRINGHDLSDNIYIVTARFNDLYIIPQQLAVLIPMYLHSLSLDDSKKSLTKMEAILREKERVNFAYRCGEIIQDAYFSLGKRRIFSSIKNKFIKNK